MKKISEFILGLGMGIAFCAIGIAMGIAISFAIKSQFILNWLAVSSVIEELLKFSAVVGVMWFFSVGSSVAVSIGMGFGLWELLVSVFSRGVGITDRLLPFFFHILTGIILWIGLKRGAFWQGVALGLNIVLHLGLNLFLIPYLFLVN